MKEATPDKVYETLSSASKVSKRYDLNVGELRPCIGKMMETPLFKGSFPQRNEACLVIASELRRVGKNEERVLEILGGWNWKNIDPLKESEVRSAVSTAFRKEITIHALILT